MAKVSSKNQVTLPVAVMREAGIEPGDDVVIRAVGTGRLAVERRLDSIMRFAGCLPPGTVPPGWLDELRNEWR